MTATTLSLTEITRLKLDTTPGLPKLPHIPESLDIKLTPSSKKPTSSMLRFGL